MKRLILGSTVAALACMGTLQAQAWGDAFNYAAGTTIGNWNEFLRDWQSDGTQAVSENIRNYQHLTNTTDTTTSRDCCVDVVVNVNPAGQTLQFGGVIIRANDPGSGSFGSDLIHLKAQGGLSGFNRAWLYENSVTGSLSNTSAAMTSSTRARVRVLAIDSRVVGRIDHDMDGSWDVSLTKTVTLPVKMGPVGLCGYGGAIMDDFRHFNAVLLESTTSPAPNPGNTIELAMRGDANATYVAAISAGTGPIALGPTSGIPLSPDNFFFASLQGVFGNLVGVLDRNGDGTLKIAIPNVPGLAGISFYTAYVNAQPGITHISNDHQTTIQ